MIGCLIRHGANLNPSLCELLYRAAIQMANKGYRDGRIFDDDVKGRISTEWTNVDCGPHLSGVIFDAELVHRSGITQIQYVVHEKDLNGEVGESIWARREFVVPADGSPPYEQIDLYFPPSP